VADAAFALTRVNSLVENDMKGFSMNRSHDYLFTRGDANAVQQQQSQQLNTEIAQIDSNRLLNTNIDALVGYLVEKYRVEVPELDESGMQADQKEAQRDVSGDPNRVANIMGRTGPLYVIGTEVTVEVPFSGDAGLFNVRPNTYSTSFPHGEVRDNLLIFRTWTDKAQSAQIRSQIDAWLGDVKRHLQWHRDSFQGFNQSLASLARLAITQRRDKLLASQSLVAGLGIPLKRRPDAVKTYSAPEVKRKLTPKMPPASPGTFKPEPVLEEGEYQHILSVLEGMIRVMEQSPKAFHEIDEETLRTHFLVQLNGHYEGQATGETFNYEGKTDILIRSGERNIFVGECKFWGGPAKLTETINQLLGYLTWRDSKAAILIFNRNKDFSKVLAAIPGTIAAHPNFNRDEGKRSETSFRYEFRHKDDAAKMMHITVLAFDIPTPGA
jgi:hypothetical protein